MQDLDRDIENDPLVGQRNEKLLGIADIHVRHGFIRKVYSILSVQLFVTAVVAYVTMEWAKTMVKTSPQTVTSLLTVSMTFSMGIMLVFACCPGSMRHSPSNYLMLMLFTIAEAVLVGIVCLHYTEESLLLVFAVTCIIVISLTIFACQTKTDFTGFGPYLLVGCLVLLCFGFVMSFASMFGTGGAAFQGMRMVYAMAGTTIFAGYLVFDTQMIVADKHATMRYEVDDYCAAAIGLYVDIIQLFLNLLTLLGRENGDGL